MNIVIDMNLSPQWVSVLAAAGHHAVHWSDVGAANALDREIMEWARSNGFVVFTHDLDFGTMLAFANAKAPSLFQVRTQDIAPGKIGPLVVFAFSQFEESLSKGAIVTIDEKRSRVRILPLRGRE